MVGHRHRPEELSAFDWAAVIVMGILLLATVWAVVAAIFAIGPGP